jgi:hypothetical protein
VTRQALTVVAPVESSRVPALRDDLATIAADLDDNALVPFGRLPRTHFARFVIVEPYLVFESCHDGEREDYVEALVAACGDGLARLYGVPRAGLSSFLLAHAHAPAAFHAAYREHPVTRIENDRLVRERIGRFLDEHPEMARRSPAEIQAAVRAQLGGLDLATEGDGKLLRLVRLVAAGAPLAAAALVLSPILLAWMILIRRAEKQEHAKARRPDASVRAHPTLVAAEDHVVQNQLTHVVALKPGWLRRVTLRTVFWVIDLAARRYWNQGELGGITSIHFARWVFLPDGRLLFTSNYDGSWEAYLGDFIDQASPGLTAVWSNTEGFPATEWLVGAGSRDEEAFKQWTRDHQVATQVWWSSCQDSTVANILRDREIRRQAAADLDARAAAAWVELL